MIVEVEELEHGAPQRRQPAERPMKQVCAAVSIEVGFKRRQMRDKPFIDSFQVFRSAASSPMIAYRVINNLCEERPGMRDFIKAPEGFERVNGYVLLQIFVVD